MRLNSGVSRVVSKIDSPDVTVVIPTRDRPDKVIGAVESALAQVACDVEVIVVDDGPDVPVTIPPHRSIRCVRLDRNQGPAAARNAGLAVARGRYITFLDDDDRLLPHMADVSLSALANSDLASPVAVISGMEVIDRFGEVIERRIPPTHAKGGHFSLEPLPSGRSHVTKNTLVVERQVLLSLGGFDTTLAACEWIDLFLRLNPECSVLGIPDITYRLTRGSGRHFSRDTRKRERGFRQLEAKHGRLFAAYPAGHAAALLGEARMALAAGSFAMAARSVGRALWVAPRHTAAAIASPTRWGRSLWNLQNSG